MLLTQTSKAADASSCGTPGCLQSQQ